MSSYSLLADLKSYLNITTSTDDVLLQVMLDAATSRIDAETQRTFQAASDTVRYFDPTEDVCGGKLELDCNLSYITSVLNGDGSNITTDIITNPRNATPYYSLQIKGTAGTVWAYTDDYENSIVITGRWAWMERQAITALSRSAGSVVTATVTAPRVCVGASVFVTGVADSTFNGTFTVVSNSGAAITWAQSGTVDTDTTGVLLFTPTDIVMACRRFSSWLYRQKDTQMGDIDRPVMTGDGVMIMPTTLPNDVTRLLAPYRNPL